MRYKQYGTLCYAMLCYAMVCSFEIYRHRHHSLEINKITNLKLGICPWSGRAHELDESHFKDVLEPENPGICPTAARAQTCVESNI